MNAATKIEAATLASAMAAAFSEIEGATKATQGQVGQQKYKYADLTSVIDAIKPALINHSLFFTQHPEPSDKGVCIETVLHHAGGESLSLGKLFVPANKQDAQGYGSALTYARRYALVTAFGVPVEDDDGNAASKAAGGSGRDNTEGRQASPDTGTANTSQPSGRINEVQLSKLQMLLKATKTDPLSFCREMGAPEGAQLFQMLQEKYPDALTTLETRLADMAKAETNSAAASGFGELLDDEIKY